jgi:hypothetical protein
MFYIGMGFIEGDFILSKSELIYVLQVINMWHYSSLGLGTTVNTANWCSETQGY